MRIPSAVPFKVRTGAPDKDAKLKNAYVEVKNGQTVVRKRPAAQGGVAVGSGTAQGGIGLVIAGVPYVYVINGDEINGSTLTGGAIGVSGYGSSIGTNWSSGASYSIGDHVSYDFVDYWALTDNTNSNPTSNPSDWSQDYVPSVPQPTYAVWEKINNFVLSGGDLVATYPAPYDDGQVISSITKSSGKWYCEITITATGMDFMGGTATDLSGIGSPSVTLSNGDVFGFALDMDAGNAYLYVNNVLVATDTGLSGSYGVGITPGDLGDGCTGTLTANFGASAFTYSVPAGYNSGLYT